jgi:hypothetical protein
MRTFRPLTRYRTYFGDDLTPYFGDDEIAIVGINTARAMTAAVIDAGRWIDASLNNRQKTAEVVSDKSYVNCEKDVIVARMLGRYDNGIGKKWDEPDYMKFSNEGTVNYPYLSDGMWFMTQHRRWGLLKEDPDYLEVAKKVNRIDIYKDAAAMTKTPLPKDPMRSAKLMDGVALMPAVESTGTWLLPSSSTRFSSRSPPLSRLPCSSIQSGPVSCSQG